MGAGALSRIIVVGGSLGGLNVAAWLHRAGFPVEVFERSPVPLEDRGAGLVLNPATIRFFVAHRLLDVARISASARWYRYLAPGGRVEHEAPCAYRFTAYNVLYRSLLQCIDQRHYHLGEECIDFQQESNEIVVRFASGRVERCDLLICADGINSTGRRLLAPEARPRYAGYVAWRGTIGEDQLSPDAFAALHESMTYCLMPDSHALAYPIPNRDGAVEPGRRLSNWLWYRNVPPGPELDDMLTGRDGERFTTSVPPGAVHERQVARLRDEARTLSPDFAEMIAATPDPFLQVIVDVEVLSMAFGRVCLIGDAAFTARPHVAAGTAKATEDGWQLVEALKEFGGDVERALAAWNARQVALGRRVVQRAKEVGDRLQHGRWGAMDPLPYGLYTVGDSALPDTGAGPASGTTRE